jgi:hypothetical protein
VTIFCVTPGPTSGKLVEAIATGCSVLALGVELSGASRGEAHSAGISGRLRNGHATIRIDAGGGGREADRLGQLLAIGLDDEAFCGIEDAVSCSVLGPEQEGAASLGLLTLQADELSSVVQELRTHRVTLQSWSPAV